MLAEMQVHHTHVSSIPGQLGASHVRAKEAVWPRVFWQKSGRLLKQRRSEVKQELKASGIGGPSSPVEGPGGAVRERTGGGLC